MSKPRNLACKTVVYGLLLDVSGTVAQNLSPSACVVHKNGVEFIVGGNPSVSHAPCSVNRLQIETPSATKEAAKKSNPPALASSMRFSVDTPERLRIVREELVEERAVLLAFQNALSKDASNAELRRKVEIRQFNVEALEAELKSIGASR
jgi:hypothetical protein